MSVLVLPNVKLPLAIVYPLVLQEGVEPSDVVVAVCVHVVAHHPRVGAQEFMSGSQRDGRVRSGGKGARRDAERAERGLRDPEGRRQGEKQSEDREEEEDGGAVESAFASRVPESRVSVTQHVNPAHVRIATRQQMQGAIDMSGEGTQHAQLGLALATCARTTHLRARMPSAAT